MDKDVNSPPRHSAFSNYYELIEFLMVLQELSGGKPVGFKLCVGRHSEFMCIVKAMLEVGFVTNFVCNSILNVHCTLRTGLGNTHLPLPIADQKMFLSPAHFSISFGQKFKFYFAVKKTGKA